MEVTEKIDKVLEEGSSAKSFASEIEEALYYLEEQDRDPDEGHELRIESFQDAGVMSGNTGLVITRGQEKYFVTIVGS